MLRITSDKIDLLDRAYNIVRDIEIQGEMKMNCGTKVKPLANGTFILQSPTGTISGEISKDILLMALVDFLESLPIKQLPLPGF